MCLHFRANAAYLAGVSLLKAFMRSELKSERPADSAPAFDDACILRLAGAQLPQLGDKPLFFRWFYLPCIEGPMSNLDPDVTASTRRFIVLGNPGSEWARILCLCAHCS